MWKILLSAVGIAVAAFVVAVVRMAVAEAKEEADDIDRAGKGVR